VRTYQLRRYQIAAGAMPGFTDWLHSTLIPVREGFGYRVEFQLIDHEANEFVWCVSLAGDQAEFLKIQEQYNTSSERAKAFETFPKCIDSMQISFVEALDLPK
jgi:hypothetical protein